MTQARRHKAQIPRFPPNCQNSQKFFIYNRSNNNFIWTYMDGQQVHFRPTLQAIRPTLQVKTSIFQNDEPRLMQTRLWLQGYHRPPTLQVRTHSSGPIPTLQANTTHSSGPILTLQPKNHPLFSSNGLCHGISSPTLQASFTQTHKSPHPSLTLQGATDLKSRCAPEEWVTD